MSGFSLEADDEEDDSGGIWQDDTHSSWLGERDDDEDESPYGNGDDEDAGGHVSESSGLFEEYANSGYVGRTHLEAQGLFAESDSDDGDDANEESSNDEVEQYDFGGPSGISPELATTQKWRLNEEAFSNLCVAEISDNARPPFDAECSICCQHPEEDPVTGSFEPCYVLPCADTGCPSYFHAACIRPWLERNPTCPLCRRNVEELVFRVDASSPPIASSAADATSDSLNSDFLRFTLAMDGGSADIHFLELAALFSGGGGDYGYGPYGGLGLGFDEWCPDSRRSHTPESSTGSSFPRGIGMPSSGAATHADVREESPHSNSMWAAVAAAAMAGAGDSPASGSHSFSQDASWWDGYRDPLEVRRHYHPWHASPLLANPPRSGNSTGSSGGLRSRGSTGIERNPENAPSRQRTVAMSFLNRDMNTITSSASASTLSASASSRVAADRLRRARSGSHSSTAALPPNIGSGQSQATGLRRVFAQSALRALGLSPHLAS